MIPAMVLCAGFGTRLRPLSVHFPKPLLPIGDRPALQHIIDQLRAQACSPIVVNTHHCAAMFERSIPADVTLIREPRILGTAGGVANASEAIGPGTVIVWNGDIHLDLDFRSLLETHRRFVGKDNAIATMLVSRQLKGNGTVGVGPGGLLARLRGVQVFEEISRADYVGVMVLGGDGRSLLPGEGCLVGDFLMPRLRTGSKVGIAWHDGDWVDIGSVEQYYGANMAWLRKHGST